MIPITSILIGVAAAIIAAMVVMLAYSFHASSEEDPEKEVEVDREANLNRLRIYLKRRKHVAIGDVERLLDIPKATAQAYLEALVEEELLKPSNPRSRHSGYDRIA